ncbi:hypothetical protein CHLNCDRAFT_20573 [Chlorella variabilis]|uniref:Ubiquitin-like domain-containing protein n=1 Tax=Chlorella variabilis TaxID=554065 RepID=E1Z7N2_CHLVA|nr:hypothetical protein CHLNCDRAFT_20573 [Chlorella variabilis]EFN57949.1 hypothetical protein CHLNCDRAFT_20573 [Chlorella variabilis]|eukprot:XP_005850051.1 hypothetical protein CHLNCDRAFT_20573 [Chlorella variabilis]
MGAIKLSVKSRTGRELLPDGLLVPSDATVDDLKARFAELKPRYYASRQRFTLPPREGQRSGEALAAGKKLSDYGLQDGSVLLFKDLGAQIGYATVFFWEYLGPLVVYPLFYFLPQYLYPGVKEKSVAQTLALAYWTFHYLKRLLETFFVHKFSHATMPVFNLVKNCSYYWGFAAFVAYFVNHPLYTPPPPQQAYATLAFSMLCQFANFRCHVILANLRPAGAKGYVIPRGFLFNLITCPNYTAEILGWVGFTVATQTAAAALFTLVGAGQMARWALGKHKRLIKTFDGREGREKYPRRWIMLPPFF